MAGRYGNSYDTFQPKINSGSVESVYNEAVFAISRLSQLWAKVHTAYLAGNLVDMNHLLSTIWIELSADSTRLNKTKYWGEYKTIQNKIFLAQKKKSRGDYLIALEEKELFLKELQYSCGKGSTYKKSRTSLSF